MPSLLELRDQAREWLGAEDFEGEAAAAVLLAVYLEHRPEDGYAWLMYGDALREVGRLSESKEALLKAVVQAPEGDLRDVQASLGSLLHDRDEHAEAERFYAQATATNPRGCLWVLRGGNLACQGEFRGAIACQRQAIASKDADHDEAYLNLGLVLRAMQAYEPARQAFLKALAITPDYPEARRALSSIELAFEAMEMARRLGGLARTKKFKASLLAELQRQAKEWHDAEDIDGAAAVIVLLSAYLEHCPDNGYAWFMYGDSLRVIGRTRDGLQALLQALERAPEIGLPFVQASLGTLHARQGDLARAERYYAQATATASDLPGWVWIVRGENLARLEDFQGAAVCQRQAIASEDGPHDEAYYHLGFALRAMQAYEPAREAFQQALAITPDYPEAQRALSSIEPVFEAIAMTQDVDGCQQYDGGAWDGDE